MKIKTIHPNTLLHKKTHGLQMAENPYVLRYTIIILYRSVLLLQMPDKIPCI